MEFVKFPDEKAVEMAMKNDEPLLVLVSLDGKTVIMSHIDEEIEHHILLVKAGFSDKDIDKYFRIVLDKNGADWTFVCPPDYKGISDKTRRIKQFYKDGFATLSDVLNEINYMVGINIPRRYRRHFDEMTNEA